MRTSRTIFVAGAGIGGLTASLALAKAGFRVVVLEKTGWLEEVGAGLQLSPNATRVLIDLGLQKRLATFVVAPEAISVMSARAGGEIIRLKFGKGRILHGSDPYWVVHRADLQLALQAEVDRNPDIELRLGCRFEGAVADARGVTVTQRSGTTRKAEHALALIGADGVWSAVRGHLFPAVKPQFSGLVAWRGTLEATELPPEYTSHRVQLWMGPKAHLVVYPISGGRQMNVVAVVRGMWDAPGWNAAGDAAELNNVFAAAHWPDSARMMIAAVDGWRKWPLFGVPDDCEWTRGPIALLGDAVHAMLPFAAQGAGMAIEDAAVLAKCLSEGAGENEGDDLDVAAAFERYVQMRRARVTKVKRTARQNGRIYHLTGPAALARDLAIKAMGPRLLLGRHNWIYDWRL